ncbi:MAG: ABC transporter ATP-binding protein [Spirochaetales bacterium]|nr:ABC transporter ATP-binding protein [Spirochaetales bacterium]
MDQLVEIRDLVKEFYGRGLLARKRGAFKAVDRVSFDIRKNTIFGLVGESGCGKTTVSRALLYLDPPTSGQVLFDGATIGELSGKALRGYRRRMQIVFQDPNSALNPKMKIGSSLEEGLINLGVSKPQRLKRVEEMLELVGITPSHQDRYPHEFSGGQKQRIVVARALTMQPDFLVLDEPVSNLDVSIQAQIINLLLDLKERLSLTYLFISHDLNLVAYISDRIAVMYRGRIVELGSTEQIMERPVHPYTLKLFSASPSLHGTLQGSDKAQEGQAAEESTGGCPYAAQCDRRDSDCLEQEPELRDIGEGHLVACIHDKQHNPA